MEQPDENCCNGDDPRIKTREIDYDANGNQLEIKETIGELEVSLRKNLWDEENRLTAVNLKPDSNTQHPIGVYTYDAGGDRIIKRNLNRLKIRSNAKEQEDVEEDNVMLYPSGLIIAKPDNKSKRNRPSVSYTKHYYVGSERVASKIGTTDELGGIPNVINTVIPNLNIEEIHYWSTTRLIEAGAALQSVYSTFNLQPPTLNPLTQYSGIGFSHTGDLEVFYFHPDHLGSSSYITNLDGNVTQHMEYLPFGETLVDEHTNSNNSPFKFNGKELDEETGNYYYGARYYNPKWSIWLSVDPMAEKYPSFSSYAYTLQNPIRYTDPTGMVVEEGKAVPPNWYRNKSTNDVEYYEGSGEKDGYENLGASTNLVASNYENHEHYSLNENGSFTNSDTGKNYNKGESRETISGTGIKSNLTLGEKASRYSSNMAAFIVEVPQDIGIGIINQLDRGFNLAISGEDKAVMNNYLIQNSYNLDNWSIVKGRSASSTGRPTWEEGKRKITNTLSAVFIPLTLYKPVFNTAIPAVNKYAPTLIDEAIKAGVTEGTNRTLNSIKK
ncbi:RHS repeat-associated core domain-containing protein [Mesonia sp. MT50]|uniref:RHS repeat-associated core domain-containing protein n=1 Tax=Mesonia profundi TaxID=3070998 RepID=A0ABU1A2H5_9FLAO|nr:RHS repeat-associated core domain-containing protein [Mesonia profundi]MDQ7917834.1 RHS repeat-associated core domain-containing protein [Mesonia profundi]